MNAGEVAKAIASRGGSKVRSDGAGGFLLACPAHDDRRPSLHIATGKRQSVILHCHAGCPSAEVLARGGLSWRDICGTQLGRIGAAITATYDYRDACGRHLFSIGRAGDGQGKRFVCYSFAETGALIRGLGATPRVLYRLPETLLAIASGEEVYLCEGEKDVEAMRAAYGVAATTNAFGGTAWAADSVSFDYPATLRGARLSIVEHDDAAGRHRTLQILASLSDVAASLRILKARQGNDAYDHIAAGYGLEDLVEVPFEACALRDEGIFAALPAVFFRAAMACNLSHLDHRVLVEVAHHSVRRERETTLWQPLTCPSSWLARCCGNASPSAVREALRRLERAHILIGGSDPACGLAKVVRLNERYEEWRPVVRNARRPHRLRHRHPSAARTELDRCKDTSTREDLGVREERIGGSA